MLLLLKKESKLVPIIDFRKILIEAYKITKDHKILWFFGLLLVGATPVISVLDKYSSMWLFNLLLEPYQLMRFSLIVLVLGIFGMYATNASRLGFILKVINSSSFTAKLLLKNKQKIPAQSFWKSLGAVLLVSFVTVIIMAGIGGVLLLPYLWFPSIDVWVRQMLPMGTVLGAALGFMVSVVNIFACLFLVYYKMSVKNAIYLAVDLLKTKWVDLLVLGGALLVAHSIIFVAAKLLVVGVEMLPSILPVFIERVAIGIVFWLAASIFSAYFNTAIILVFFEIIEDIENPEFKGVKELVHQTQVGYKG